MKALRIQPRPTKSVTPFSAAKARYSSETFSRTSPPPSSSMSTAPGSVAYAATAEENPACPASSRGSYCAASSSLDELVSAAYCA